MLRKISTISSLKKRERLFVLVLVCSGIGLLAAAFALAGEYHIGDSLICAQCHTMHYSQQHTYSGAVGTGSPLSTPPQATMGGGGPYTNLLRHEVNDLCLSCHDGQTFAPDVLGTETAEVAYVRQAGGLTRKDVSVGAGYAETNGHTVGWTLAFNIHGIPGIGGWGDFPCNNCHNGGAWPPPIAKRFPERKLACVSCHDPHGAVSHRNLAFVDDTVRLITYAIDTGSGSDTTKDVYLRDWEAGNISGSTSNYRLENVDFNEPSGNPGMSGFCSKCHGFFHGTASDGHMRDQGGPSGINWLRHPTGDANIGDYSSDGKHSSLTVFGGNRNRLKVMSPGGDWGVDEDGVPLETWDPVPDNLTPTCITCHKAHGNKNPFALIYMVGSGDVTEEGTADGEYTDLCHQCHVQGIP
ncbi:cytochrome c3 family protein [Candidatus Poribacteria bacterium]